MSLTWDTVALQEAGGLCARAPLCCPWERALPAVEQELRGR